MKKIQYLKFSVIFLISVGLLSCSNTKKATSIVNNNCDTSISSSDISDCYIKNFSSVIKEEKFVSNLGDIITQKQCQVRESKETTHLVAFSYFKNKLRARSLSRLDQFGERQVIFGNNNFETLQFECKGSWKKNITNAISFGSDVGLIPWGSQLEQFVGKEKCKKVRRRYPKYTKLWFKKRKNTFKAVYQHCGHFQKNINKIFKKYK